MEDVGRYSRRIAIALLLTSSLFTAGFALNSTVFAQPSGCCLVIANCIGSTCYANEECGAGAGYCCASCPE